MSDIHLPIYLDYSATTPIDERVARKMAEYLTINDQFGNPASRSHEFGWKAEEAVDLARKHVAELVNADPREIIWTSGATESDNLAIKGAAHFYKKKGNHIITVKTEHKAVLDPLAELSRRGYGTGNQWLNRPGEIQTGNSRRYDSGLGNARQQ